MYSRHNEGKSVIAERFLKTLKSKTYIRRTSNNRKSYLPYLNKLVDQNNNIYHHSINKNPKAPKLKVNHRFRITKCKNIFSKFYPENWSRKLFIIDFVLKTNPWTYKIKDLNGEKIIGKFY